MKEDLHPYRSHTCGVLREEHVGDTVRLSGWIHSKRDHGNLVFIDLRDEFGLTQCVIDVSSSLFQIIEMARVESVITVTGPVVERSVETVNLNITTGRVEVQIAGVEIESAAEVLPMLVAGEQEFGEGLHFLKYLDPVLFNDLYITAMSEEEPRRWLEESYQYAVNDGEKRSFGSN